MQKFSSMNSLLIALYFSLFKVITNPRLRIVWRIIIAMFLTILTCPFFSVAYLTDEMILGPEFSLNSETDVVEPISGKENVPKFTDHIIAITGIVIVAVFVLWRFSKGDSTVAIVSPKMICNG